LRQHNNNGSYNNNRNSSYNKSSTDKPKSGLTVEVRNGDVTKALRIFKKKVAEAGIIQEVRDRQEFVKPSKKRARAKAAGIARWRKKVRDGELEGLRPTSKSKRR
jgi:small subunit ribosomal protein S21|tara:strand:+ start:189 stop:503 length:315 start_codon:yes stop_codon:yes gene_type:complete